MNLRIKNHFRKVDPKLFQLLEGIGDCKDPWEDLCAVPPKEYLSLLCREIVAQQLSSKAAAKIGERFTSLFPGGQVTPKRLLALRNKTLREKAGISFAKIQYLKGLAKKVEKKELVLQELRHLPDEEVISQLTRVKGIGKWTAEMFLMFALGREDVFSAGDFGLRKAIAKMYGIQNLTREKAEKLSLRWSPHRTFASLILWHSNDHR